MTARAFQAVDSDRPAYQSVHMDRRPESGNGDTRLAAAQIEEWDPKDLEEREKYEYYLVDDDERQASSGFGSRPIPDSSVSISWSPRELSNVEARIPMLIVDLKDGDVQPQRTRLGTVVTSPDYFRMPPDSRCRWYHLWSNNMSSVEVLLVDNFARDNFECCHANPSTTFRGWGKGSWRRSCNRLELAGCFPMTRAWLKRSSCFETKSGKKTSMGATELMQHMPDS